MSIEKFVHTFKDDVARNMSPENLIEHLREICTEKFGPGGVVSMTQPWTNDRQVEVTYVLEDKPHVIEEAGSENVAGAMDKDA